MPSRKARVWALWTWLCVISLQGSVWGDALRIGSIGYLPADEIRDFLPLARYLSEPLKTAGVEEVRVIVAGSISEMAGFMRSGKVDLYIDSVFPSMIVSELTGSRFLLRRWKRGIGEYRAVIFCKNDASISKLTDLRGKTVAFEEPFSSSGYFFPKLALLRAGLRPVPKRESSGGSVAAGDVDYVFSNADENTMAWVLRGRVNAGATDHQTFAKEARGHIKDLTILYESAPITRHLLSYRDGLSENLVGKIKQILLAMDKSASGKKALLEFHQTSKFDPVPLGFADIVSKSAPFLRQELELK
jgi:phosphonate transport system substrate-binding protein